MTIKNNDIKARLTEKESVALNYMQQQFEATKSDIVRVALDNLLKQNTFVEESSYCEIGYNFKKFEGIKSFISKKYGFFVNMWNSEDFRNKGCIEYEIYIPFMYLEAHTGLKSYDEYNKLNEDFNRLTEEDYNINDITDFIVDIKGYIEDEILNYLKENDLVEEVNY